MKFPNPIRFAHAMLRAAARVVIGHPRVDTPTRDAREKICLACPFFDSQWAQCQKCSCFVPLKIELSSESCPEGKWRKKLTPWGFLTSLVNARRN